MQRRKHGASDQRAAEEADVVQMHQPGRNMDGWIDVGNETGKRGDCPTDPLAPVSVHQTGKEGPLEAEEGLTATMARQFTPYVYQ